MKAIETSASYEALDAQGRPYIRQPRCIHELPDPETRRRALSEATTRIEDHLALVAFKDIGFGEPAYVAFGMSKPQAEAHRASKLLLTMGCDISLEFTGSLSQGVSFKAMGPR